MKIFRLIAAAALGLSLQACASAPQTVDMTAMSKAAFAARASYGIALSIATAYVKLPRCGQPASPTLCSDPQVVQQMRKADVAADEATKAAESAVRTLGSSPDVVQASVVAAQQSVAALSAIAKAYSKE